MNKYYKIKNFKRINKYIVINEINLCIISRYDKLVKMKCTYTYLIVYKIIDCFFFRDFVAQVSQLSPRKKLLAILDLHNIMLYKACLP